MVTAGGSRPISDFPATISKKLNNDNCTKSTDNQYVFLVKLCQNICEVLFSLRYSVYITQTGKKGYYITASVAQMLLNNILNIP